jgi:hypothetical protein
MWVVLSLPPWTKYSRSLFMLSSGKV